MQHSLDQHSLDQQVAQARAIIDENCDTHRQLQRMLWQVARVMSECALEYYPTCGTLLGLVRERDLLLHDDDLDVALVLRHQDHAKALADALQALQTAARRHGLTFGTHPNLVLQNPKEGQDQKQEQKRFCFQSLTCEAVFCDVYLWTPAIAAENDRRRAANEPDWERFLPRLEHVGSADATVAKKTYRWAGVPEEAVVLPELPGAEDYLDQTYAGWRERVLVYNHRHNDYWSEGHRPDKISLPFQVYAQHFLKQ